MLKLQYFGHLMWPMGPPLEKTLMEGKIEAKVSRGQQGMRWFDRIMSSKDMNLSRFWEIVKYRGAWHAVAHEIAKSHTWFHDWTTATVDSFNFFFFFFLLIISWVTRSRIWYLKQNHRGHTKPGREVLFLR